MRVRIGQSSAGILLAWMLSFLGAAVLVAKPAHSAEQLAADDTAAQAFFASPDLWRVQVDIDHAAYLQLARQPRKYVPGSVRIGGRTYQGVGVRLKGTGTFEPVTRHPNLTLKFNWQTPEQTLSGLTKLYLNNSRQDPTLLCELAASGAFADAGVPVPRITHGLVELNGRELGLCVVAEAVNKRFLRRHFADTHGNLYEGEFRDIRARLDQDNGTPGPQLDLKKLAAAALLQDPEERRHSLEQVLDVNEFLNFLAVEMMVANWDGYAFHQNNYRVYHNPGSGHMAFIPHGLDNTFFESEISLMPPRTSVLASALLASPEERDAFRKRVATLLPLVLDTNVIKKRLQIGAARLSQGVSPATAAAITRRAEIFQQRVQERHAHLCAELAGRQPAAPQFDRSGAAPLSGWKAKADWNDSAVARMTNNGTLILSVQATNGYCFGSWRLPVWLAPGRYQIEGLARTTSVDGLPSRTGSGAGVRTPGTMRGSGIQGSAGWSPVQHEFVVEPGCEWVELIAELRAYRGSALFAADKLRLVRLP